MPKEKESPLAFLKPSFMIVGIFLLFVLIYFLGSYENAPFSDKPMKFKPPIFQQYHNTLPTILASLFSVLWAVISMPLFLVGRAFILMVSYLGINVYDYLNDVNVFIIFLLYYYFLASVIASAMKREN